MGNDFVKPAPVRQSKPLESLVVQVHVRAQSRRKRESQHLLDDLRDKERHDAEHECAAEGDAVPARGVDFDEPERAEEVHDSDAGENRAKADRERFAEQLCQQPVNQRGQQEAEDVTAGRSKQDAEAAGETGQHGHTDCREQDEYQD